MADALDRMIDGFKLLSSGGGGGQGNVSKAECVRPVFDGLKPGAVVALKEMPVVNEDEEGKAWEKLSSRTAELVRLDHPNVVRYWGCFIKQGELNDSHVVVQEYLEGETLKQRLQRFPGGLDTEEAILILGKALAGMEYTAAHGIVHRDVKPSNIFLCLDKTGAIEEVKLIDFEIARREGGTTTTGTGGLPGTYDYMAPDFITTGFRGDEQSDVFSMGVVMYETLTGKMPYLRGKDEGSPDFAYFSRWTQGSRNGKSPIHISSRVRQLLTNADQVLLRALAPDRKARYAGFTAFREGFGEIHFHDLKNGERRYRILQRIGKGGFGEVFKARIRGTNQHVAIKHLLKERSEKRFDKEASILCALHDPCFVQFVDFFERQHSEKKRDVFLVMAFLPGMPGSSLRDAIKGAAGEGLDYGETLRAFICYAHGLAVLHEKGLIHRDIKPSNLYFPKGSPENSVIMDFGIVRDLHGTMTTGEVPGTPDWMPPETVRVPNGNAKNHSRGDSRMDIYALGLCLFEALTGKTAYPRLPAGAPGRIAFLERAGKLLPPDLSAPLLDENAPLRDLITAMTQPDFRLRLDRASEVERRLREILDGVAQVEPSRRKTDVDVQPGDGGLDGADDEPETSPTKPTGTLVGRSETNTGSNTLRLEDIGRAADSVVQAYRSRKGFKEQALREGDTRYEQWRVAWEGILPSGKFAEFSEKIEEARNACVRELFERCKARGAALAEDFKNRERPVDETGAALEKWKQDRLRKIFSHAQETELDRLEEELERIRMKRETAGKRLFYAGAAACAVLLAVGGTVIIGEVRKLLGERRHEEADRQLAEVLQSYENGNVKEGKRREREWQERWSPESGLWGRLPGDAYSSLTNRLAKKKHAMAEKLAESESKTIVQAYRDTEVSKEQAIRNGANRRSVWRKTWESRLPETAFNRLETELAEVHSECVEKLFNGYYEQGNAIFGDFENREKPLDETSAAFENWRKTRRSNVLLSEQSAALDELEWKIERAKGIRSGENMAKAAQSLVDAYRDPKTALSDADAARENWLKTWKEASGAQADAFTEWDNRISGARRDRERADKLAGAIRENFSRMTADSDALVKDYGVPGKPLAETDASFKAWREHWAQVKELPDGEFEARRRAVGHARARRENVEKMAAGSDALVKDYGVPGKPLAETDASFKAWREHWAQVKELPDGEFEAKRREVGRAHARRENVEKMAAEGDALANDFRNPGKPLAEIADGYKRWRERWERENDLPGGAYGKKQAALDEGFKRREKEENARMAREIERQRAELEKEYSAALDDSERNFKTRKKRLADIRAKIEEARDRGLLEKKQADERLKEIGDREKWAVGFVANNLDKSIQVAGVTIVPGTGRLVTFKTGEPGAIAATCDGFEPAEKEIGKFDGATVAFDAGEFRQIPVEVALPRLEEGIERYIQGKLVTGVSVRLLPGAYTCTFKNAKRTYPPERDYEDQTVEFTVPYRGAGLRPSAWVETKRFRETREAAEKRAGLEARCAKLLVREPYKGRRDRLTELDALLKDYPNRVLLGEARLAELEKGLQFEQGLYIAEIRNKMKLPVFVGNHKVGPGETKAFLFTEDERKGIEGIKADGYDTLPLPLGFEEDGVDVTPDRLRPSPVEVALPPLDPGVTCQIDGAAATAGEKFLPGQKHRYVYLKADYEPTGGEFTLETGGAPYVLPAPGGFQKTKAFAALDEAEAHAAKGEWAEAENKLPGEADLAGAANRARRNGLAGKIKQRKDEQEKREKNRDILESIRDRVYDEIWEAAVEKIEEAIRNGCVFTGSDKTMVETAFEKRREELKNYIDANEKQRKNDWEGNVMLCKKKLEKLVELRGALK